jgi:hypothetical protein
MTTSTSGIPKAARPPLGNRASRRTFAMKLQTAYEAGATTYSLAAEHELAVHIVWRLLKEVDTTMRPTGPAPARKRREG